MKVIDRSELLHEEKFYELDVLPISMSILLRQEDNGYSNIVVKLFIGKGTGQHINHWSKRLSYIDRNQLVMIFEIFCELYHKAFKHMSYQVFNIEDINYILEVAEKNHEFNQKFLYGLEE